MASFARRARTKKGSKGSGLIGPSRSGHDCPSRPAEFSYQLQAELVNVVQSLYDDEVTPFGRIVRKRLAERVWDGAVALDTLYDACLANTCLSVEDGEGGAWTVLLKGRQPTFVDVYSTEDPFPQMCWEAAQKYFRDGSAQDLRLPGGRYACAEALKGMHLPFLEGLSLGQICHWVQLATTKWKILGYTQGDVVPYTKSMSMLKEALAGRQLPCGVKAALSGRVANWDQAVSLLAVLLNDAGSGEDPAEIPMSHLKRIFRSRFRVELSETALGYTRLYDLLKDQRFAQICDVLLRGTGYVIVQRIGARAAVRAQLEEHVDEAGSMSTEAAPLEDGELSSDAWSLDGGCEMQQPVTSKASLCSPLAPGRVAPLAVRPRRQRDHARLPASAGHQAPPPSPFVAAPAFPRDMSSPSCASPPPGVVSECTSLSRLRASGRQYLDAQAPTGRRGGQAAQNSRSQGGSAPSVRDHPGTQPWSRGGYPGPSDMSGLRPQRPQMQAQQAHQAQQAQHAVKAQVQAAQQAQVQAQAQAQVQAAAQAHALAQAQMQAQLQARRMQQQAAAAALRMGQYPLAGPQTLETDSMSLETHTGPYPPGPLFDAASGLPADSTMPLRIPVSEKAPLQPRQPFQGRGRGDLGLSFDAGEDDEGGSGGEDGGSGVKNFRCIVKNTFISISPTEAGSDSPTRRRAKSLPKDMGGSPRRVVMQSRFVDAILEGEEDEELEMQSLNAVLHSQGVNPFSASNPFLLDTGSSNSSGRSSGKGAKEDEEEVYQPGARSAGSYL